MSSETQRLNQIVMPFNFVGFVMAIPLAYFMGDFLIGAPKVDMSDSEWKQFASQRFFECVPKIAICFGLTSLVVNTSILWFGSGSLKLILKSWKSVLGLRGCKLSKTEAANQKILLILPCLWAGSITLFLLLVNACGCYSLYLRQPPYFD